MIEFEVERFRIDKRLTNPELARLLGTSLSGLLYTRRVGRISLDKIRILEGVYGNLDEYFKSNGHSNNPVSTDGNMDVV